VIARKSKLARSLQCIEHPANAAINKVQLEVFMFKSDLARTVTAIACTVVFSATAVLAAVGPATQPNASGVAAAARLTA
jgi:hypothetical protein